EVGAGPTKVHPHVSAIGPTQARKGLRERGEGSLKHRIVFVLRHEHADAANAVALLRAHRDRPCCCAAKKSNELASSDAEHGLIVLNRGVLSAPPMLDNDTILTGRQIGRCTATI